jgi:hypothetical protein
MTPLQVVLKPLLLKSTLEKAFPVILPAEIIRFIMMRILAKSSVWCHN